MVIATSAIEDAICSFVEGLFPRGSAGMLVVSLIMEARSSEKRIEIYLGFHRTSNYTKVLRVVGDRLPSPEEIDVWELASYHDSGWRSDGVGHSITNASHKLSKLAGGQPDEIMLHFNPLRTPKIHKVTEVEVNRETGTALIKW